MVIQSSDFCGVYMLKLLANLTDKYCEQTKFNNGFKWNNDLCMPIQLVFKNLKEICAYNPFCS